jgi:hypothetical protein
MGVTGGTSTFGIVLVVVDDAVVVEWPGRAPRACAVGEPVPAQPAARSEDAPSATNHFVAGAHLVTRPQ